MISARKTMAAGILLATALLPAACTKLLDKQPQNTLAYAQVYNNLNDADAAVIGLYGKFMGLAKQYVVLNELRGDLMEVTDNADGNLREINQHKVSADNPYANPRPYYALINDCNDVLKNLNIMLAKNKLKTSEFQQRYSDVGAMRSWLYLQLGIHWGSVPYITDPLETVDDAKDPSKYPRKSFNELLDTLIAFTSKLPFLSPYPTGTGINVNLVTSVDGSLTTRFFIDKYMLLGDLNLWRNNYRTAASYYRLVLEHTGYDLDNPGALYSGGDQFYQEFRQAFADVTNHNDLCVGYIRGQESNKNALIESNTQGWRSMFSRPQDNLFRQQMLWVLPFNSNFSPTNPFIDLFSNVGGSYLVKPSQQAMDYWNAQVQENNFPYDARASFTWKMLGGQPVIMKYLYGYIDGNTLVATNLLAKNGQWFLQRAANLHLRFAEAANRDGRYRLAYAFVNKGIGPAYDNGGSGTGRDVTLLQNTLGDPETVYQFDARQGDYPRYRSDWYRNAGIRGCAYVKANTVTGDSLTSIENSILTEGALELAYEGYRWPDLVRIARRRNDPTIVALAVYNKMLKDNIPGAADTRDRLMNPDNWYLPFKWQ
ncbi:MAG: RagB/SusD family nutrient uptake outer membrane protein [Bacteroidetes bacterium]|nr:RagB/SusD family nutrient uptake outer membrane protein [Bacteroidota bacterium]